MLGSFVGIKEDPLWSEEGQATVSNLQETTHPFQTSEVLNGNYNVAQKLVHGKHYFRNIKRSASIGVLGRLEGLLSLAL